MWLSILEFDKLWWEDPSKAKEFDLKYEEYQQSLPLESKIILDSRLSFYCQPDAFKVFLTVSDMVGAERIFNQQRSSDASSSLEAVLAANTQRHAWQQQAYLSLYDVDIFDMSNYTLVVDWSDKSPQQVFDEIIEHFTLFLENRWKNN